MTMLASVGPELPLDLLLATGRYAGPLRWNVERAMPNAGKWLEAKFPPWAFSILEDWAQGALDELETVVFSRANDAAQRLYYYVCELQRRGVLAGPRPIICDVARIPRATSLARDVAAVARLARHLGLDAEHIEAGIAEANARRMVRSAPEPKRPVCLLKGTPPPDTRLHAIIAGQGWHASGQTLLEEWSDPGARVEEASGDPFAALGRAMHARATGSRGFHDRGEALRAEVSARSAKAVILWFAEEDETEIWHLPEQRRALESAGIPLLTLTRRDWACGDGVEAEIVPFLAGLSA